MRAPETVNKPKQMVSLKTLCDIYDWKYDTLYKKWKRGEFVTAYRDPAGRGLRFDLHQVDLWAKQCPVEVDRPSIIEDPTTSYV